VIRLIGCSRIIEDYQGEIMVYNTSGAGSMSLEYYRVEAKCWPFEKSQTIGYYFRKDDAKLISDLFREVNMSINGGVDVMPKLYEGRVKQLENG
jgi:hypothetical protein